MVNNRPFPPRPLPPSEVAIFTWKMLNRMKNQLSDFFFQVIVDCIYFYVTLVSKCVTDQKKSFTNGQICRKVTDFLFHEFFCATFSFWDVVDFVYDKFWCTSSNTSKSTVYKIDYISITKSCTKKTHESKNPFQSIVHLSWKCIHLWRKKKC